MQSISKRRFAEPGGGRFRAIIGITLLATLASAGGRQIFANEEPTTHVVVMENMKFSPSVLRVRVGDRIEFKNADLVPHTATAKPAGAFDSGLLKPAESWVFSPKALGIFEYTCTFHPMMVGKLTVDQR
jgi:plastocyanin